MVCLTGVSYYYGTRQVLQNLNFSLSKGDRVGLVGPNGAGKTTLLRLITGILQPNLGKVLVSEWDLSYQAQQAQEIIGYAPDLIPRYPELSVIEYIEFLTDVKMMRATVKSRKNEISRVLELTHLREYLHRPLAQLSKGLRQRVVLAGGLVGNPSLLLLDEPSSGLDPLEASGFRENLREICNQENTTLLLSSHGLLEVEDLCNSVIILDKGKIVAQQPLKKNLLGDEKEVILDLEIDLTQRSKKNTLELLLTELQDLNPKIVRQESVEQVYYLSLGLNVPLRLAQSRVSQGAARLDIPLLAFSARQYGLEEVVLKLTGDEKFR